MPYMTEDQAAAEVNKWKVDFKNLKPALVTRENLWADYKSKNSDWAASMCEMGVSAATAVLTGSGAFMALNWMADAVTDGMKGAVVDKTLEKGIDRIAGAHLTDFDSSNKSYKLEADKKFATKLASGFLTILVSAVGGTLTVLTGGSAAVVTAIAIMVWVGDLEEAERKKRWGEIVNSMMKKYGDIRQKKLQKINSQHRTELESLVMSNARHDAEDSGRVKTYKWKSGSGSNIARYPTENLEQLSSHMTKIDGGLGQDLWIIDLLEISRVYREETVALWDAIDQQQGLAKRQPNAPLGKQFDKATMKAFMQRQIESHVELVEVPTTKGEKRLLKLRREVLKEYEAVEEIDEDVPDERSPLAGHSLVGPGKTLLASLGGKK